MEICYIERVASTHKHLISALKNKTLKPNLALYAGTQYDGVGSRGNSWEGCEGNLYFSLCIKEEDLCEDLPLSSISVYFAFLFKEVLQKRGSNVWLKWPNDFYLENRKIGGIISTKVENTYVVSIGLNIVLSPEKFGTLDIKITPHECCKIFAQVAEKKISWKKVFSKYRVEFQKSKSFSFHDQERAVSLEEAVLCEDGSILINNKKVYSLR